MHDTTPPPPRLIRRYANRKLYDARTSAYVALEDLAAMVRAGEEIRVIEAVSAEDITAQTLTQVILDEGKRGPSLLSTDLLHAALRRGGRALDAGREAVGGAVGSAVGQLRHGVDDLLHHSIGRLTRVLPGSRTDELDALRRQLADMERTLDALVREQRSAAGRSNAPRAVAPAADAATAPTEDPHP